MIKYVKLFRLISIRYKHNILQLVSHISYLQQSTDQNAIEQLKRQLAVFADELAVEKRYNGRLGDELGTAHGKIQALEQEVVH